MSVSAVGFGAGAIGDPRLDEDAVGSLLNRLVDAGVTLFDTAPSYGLSEERIGRHLSWRRRDVVLSTKCGYGVPGVPDWTGECIRLGVELALRRLQTEVVDVMHLHSCPLDVLRRDDVLWALERARREGKIRVAAYSGENEALEFALASGAFGSVQASLNLCDQQVIGRGLARASERQIGFLSKRTLANAPWRFLEPPAAADVALYWERLRALDLPDFGVPRAELALRFAAFTPGVSSCLVGSAHFEHAMESVHAFDQGPLPEDIRGEIRRRFLAVGANWQGQI